MKVQSPMLAVAREVASGPAEPPKKTRQLVWEWVQQNSWCTQDQVVEGLSLDLHRHTIYMQLRSLVKSGMLKMEKREHRRNKDDRCTYLVAYYHAATVEEMGKLSGLRPEVQDPVKPAKPARVPDPVAQKPAAELFPTPVDDLVKAVGAVQAPEAKAEVPRPESVAAPDTAVAILQRMYLGNAPEAMSKVSVLDALLIYRYLRPILG